MKHLFKKLAMIAMLLSFALPNASAYDFEAEGLHITIISTADFTASVSGLADSSIVDLKIPSEVTFKSRKLQVIRIDDNAFKNSNIESLSVPSSVVKIGDNAFQKCPLLKEAYLAEGLQTLGESCFSECEQLSKVNLPSTLISIPSHAFYEDSKLTQCSLKNVEDIGSYAFWGTGIAKMTIPNGCKQIGEYSFSYMKNLEEITLPSNLETIPNDCFRGCSNLKEITLPVSLRELGNYAFYYCSSLKEFNLPQSLETMGDHVLDGCPLVTELVIPDNVTSIGFYNYANLKSITFGTGLSGLPFKEESKYISGKYYYRQYSMNCYYYTYDSRFDDFNLCSNLEKVIIKDADEGFRLQCFYDENGNRVRVIPPFSNCAIKYYYVGRPVADMDPNVNEWWSTLIGMKKNCKQGEEGHIDVLEIAGKCKEVPYFFQRIDTLVLGENITKFDADNVYTAGIIMIRCKSTTPPQITYLDKIPNRTYTDAVVYVPKGTLAAYQATDGWKNFWDIREDSEIAGISDVNSERHESKPQYYDLQGRKLSKPQKGINIIKGKKVLIKQ